MRAFSNVAPITTLRSFEVQPLITQRSTAPLIFRNYTTPLIVSGVDGTVRVWDVNAKPQPLVPFLITDRRVAHPHTVGPHWFPLRSISLTVTHLPLLSGEQPCHLTYPHFQVSLTSSRAGLPSIVVPSERSISETLQRSYRRRLFVTSSRYMCSSRNSPGCLGRFQFRQLILT